jgi:prepilin-type N-terminal cleavage/methylation domain-containing protein
MNQTRESGFTLIEIMVTIVLMAIVLLALAPLTLQVARLSSMATVDAQRTAVLSGEVSRIEAEEFDDLPAGTSCVDFSSADFPHTKCTTVTDIDSETKRVTVIVTPVNGGPPDTTVVQRSKKGGRNPLHQP